jgi:methylated-DNA-[protein]-cysteine S-methyltransferase
MYVSWYDSPLGRLTLTCTDRGLTGLYMNRDADRQEDHPVFRQTKIWLDAYFRGENPPMTLALDLEGTAFQYAVWKILQTIPYGETRSYGSIAKEVAMLLGKEKMSAQAVGQAVGKNPVSILVPCHRVVGSNGQLTGYAGGMEKKIWLLEHETRQRIGETNYALRRI